jgi:hypothetical protein
MAKELAPHMKQVEERGQVKPYLIAERVTSDDDRLDPSGNGFRYPLDDDRFTEDGSVEDVSDLPVTIPKRAALHVSQADDFRQPMHKREDAIGEV